MQKVRKSMAIAMVFTAMLMPLLYLADFGLERAIHRMEMWEKLQHSRLDTIRVKAAELRWMNPDKELLVNGTFFDVYDIRIENGWATVSGFFDERERAMHLAFANSEKPGKATGNDSSLIAQWLQKEWYETVWQLHLSRQQLLVAKGHSFCLHNPICRTIAVPDQPPKLFA